MRRPFSRWDIFAIGCVALLCATTAWYRAGSEESLGEVHEQPLARVDAEPIVAPPNPPRLRGRVEPISDAISDGESWGLSTQWGSLSRVERIEQMVQVLEDTFAAPPDAASCHTAAATLSVLRADLIEEEGNRSRYDAFEARYDIFAEGCENQ